VEKAEICPTKLPVVQELKNKEYVVCPKVTPVEEPVHELVMVTGTLPD
jgi:hypothetical protein